MQRSLNDFYWFGFTNQRANLTKEIDNYNLNQCPLINGKKTSYELAIKELKLILRDSTVHFDGLSCDHQSQSSLIELAEKSRSSINHCEHEEINNFYSAYQRYGGSIVSFNEIKKRSDLVIFVGEFEEYIIESVIKKINWKSTKKKEAIYNLGNSNPCIVEKNIKRNDMDFTVNLLLDLFSDKSNNKKLRSLREKINSSKYPVIIINPNNGFIITQKIFTIVDYINNKFKKIRIFRVSGSNNSSGFVNNCVIKTGFPGSLSFNDWGVSYNPLKYNAENLRNFKNIQIYISNLNSEPNIVKFNQNIFIGHPNIKKRKDFKIFIPVKTPGIDSSGLILRSDGVGLFKLEKKIDSNYIELNQLIQELRNYD